MEFSKHNIFSKIKDSDNYFIVNPLSQNADILEPLEASLVKSIKEGKEIENKDFINELIQKGYLVNSLEEKKVFTQKYLNFLDSRDDDEIQIFFVPNYTCNFACSYCFQDEYAPELKPLTTEIIDAFFEYIQSEFRGRKKYITIFGGEPLLGGKKQFSMIENLVERSKLANIEICIVTNGYHLTDYIELLEKAPIREIQVTLDGTQAFHDARRVLKGNIGTYEKVVEGIDQCLQHNIPINLRMVVDKENINNLPALAQLAIEKGWTKNINFKTQIGRNYELHHCQTAPENLFTRVSLYEHIYELIKLHPYILEFYKPAYSVAKFLSENGEMPEPLFDSCPACKTEWAFDYTGKIYSCTATVGKADEVLGTFYPIISKKEDIIQDWQSRDVLSISQCHDCNLQLSCGGGCGSIAKNRTQTICSSDCRPITELLELGFANYLME